jgi:hypothetical protein
MLGKSLKAFFVFLLLLGAVWAAFIHLFTYQQVCGIILDLAGKPEKMSEMQNVFLVPEKFEQVRLLSLFYLLLISCTIFFLWKHLDTCIRLFLRAARSLTENIRQNINYIKGVSRFMKFALAGIFLLFLMTSLYLVVYMPVNYDEAYSYFYLTSRNIFICISYYHLPNNHVFYSILAHSFNWLPLDPSIGLRLPNIFLGMLTLFVLFAFLKDQFGRFILPGLILFTFSYPFLSYVCQGRGYVLLILFTLIGFYALLKILSGGGSLAKLSFVLANAGGMYTMPSFLYVSVCLFLSALFFILKEKKYSLLRSFLLFGLASSALTLVLYAPIIVICGPDVLYENEFVHPISISYVLNRLPDHLLDSCRWLFALPESAGWLLYSSLIAGLIFLLFSSENRKFMVIACLIFLLTPPLFTVIHRVIPFPRTWTYEILFITITVLMLMEHFFFQIRIPRFFAGLAVILTSGILIFHVVTTYIRNSDRAHKAKNLADFLLEKKIASIKCIGSYQEDMIRYYYYVENKPSPFYYGSLDEACINTEIQALVIEREKPLPKIIQCQAVKIYENPYAGVYEIKKR